MTYRRNNQTWLRSPWSIHLLVIGVPFVLWPYQITEFYGMIDAIGRRPLGQLSLLIGASLSLVSAGGIFIIIGIAGVLGASS